MNGAKNCTEIKNQIIAVQSERRKVQSGRGAEGKGHTEAVAGEAKQQQHQPGNFVARGVRELLLMNTLTHTLTHILTHSLTHRLQSELSASLKKIYQ